jgi:hypothetical protein
LRKLHSEELNDLYFSRNVIRVVKSRIMRLTGHVARTGDRRVAYKVLVVKPEGKGSIRRPRNRWEYNMEMDIEKG